MKAVKCLTGYTQKIKEAVSAGSLFKKAPTLHFLPEETATGQDGLTVLKSQKKHVVTLDIGPFDAVETILTDCSNGQVFKSEQLRSLSPYRCTYGYDVIVYVGYALFKRNCSESQIIKELADRNILISQREIGFLGKKFVAYLAIAHRQNQQRLKENMGMRGGYILHLDGTCEGDSPHLFTGMDGIAQIVLDNIKLPSEKAEMIMPFLADIKKQYGDPIALVHDMGKGILSAVDTVFKGVPDFICHFHFLRDIGKDLFETEYGKIRTRLKKHKIRGVLRKKAKALEAVVERHPEAVSQLLCDLDKNRIDSSSPIAAMPEVLAYAMIQWILSYADQLDGYGFPFDCPHLIFYQRLQAVHAFLNRSNGSGGAHPRKLLSLWRPLTKIVEDQQLVQAATQMQQKVKTFTKLREAMAIAVPKGKKALNDDGLDEHIKSIEEKIIIFRKEILQRNKPNGKNEFQKMIDQIDKYWKKLFADPITANTPKGSFVIQPQRTNNILERFFRDLKRGNRKKTGTISLNKMLTSMLADTPLVKNLDNPEYMEALLDGNSSLEERFEKIDSRLVWEKLNAENKKKTRMSPAMKKIIRFSDLPKRFFELIAA